MVGTGTVVQTDVEKIGGIIYHLRLHLSGPFMEGPFHDPCILGIIIHLEWSFHVLPAGPRPHFYAYDYVLPASPATSRP